VLRDGSRGGACAGVWPPAHVHRGEDVRYPTGHQGQGREIGGHLQEHVPVGRSLAECDAYIHRLIGWKMQIKE